MKEKAIKKLKNSFLTLIILNVISLILLFRYVILGASILFYPVLRIIFLIVGFSLTKKGNKYAGIIGLFCAILIIIDYNNILSLILGLFMLYESIQYLKIIK